MARISDELLRDVAGVEIERGLPAAVLDPKFVALLAREIVILRSAVAMVARCAHGDCDCKRVAQEAHTGHASLVCARCHAPHPCGDHPNGPHHAVYEGASV